MTFHKLVKQSICIGTGMVLQSCMMPPTYQAPQAPVQAPLPPPSPADMSSNPPSALSYGMVTGRVKKGVTTQQEIIDMFGGPSTLTTDPNGGEIWMYDKTSSSVAGGYSNTGSNASTDEAGVMATYLGIPLIAGVASSRSSAQHQSAQASQSAVNINRTVKTITFIIKFNEDKTVKDYSVRQSSY